MGIVFLRFKEVNVFEPLVLAHMNEAWVVTGVALHVLQKLADVSKELQMRG